MKKILTPVKHLQGAALNWAVAETMKLEIRFIAHHHARAFPDLSQPFLVVREGIAGQFFPSSEWAAGGPVQHALMMTDCFRIEPWQPSPVRSDCRVLVRNQTDEGEFINPDLRGQMPIEVLNADILPAVCQAFVIWHLGLEVKVPECLL